MFRSSSRVLTISAATLAVMMFLSACGSSDDGASVRVLGSEDESGSVSGSATSSGSSSGSGSSTASATAEQPCQPVGEDLESQASTTIELVASDFAYSPADIEAPAGITTFTLDNDGASNHELAFLPGGGDVGFTAPGEPDEAALEAAGAFELEGFGPGQSCNATYDLEPGTYTLFCIIHTDQGSTHYEEGMRGTLTVG